MSRNRIVAPAVLLTLFASSVAALDPRLLQPEDPSNVPFAEAAAEALRASPVARERIVGHDLEAQARTYVAREASRLGIAAASELELRSIRRGKAVDVVRFHQTAFGLPVLRTGLAVSFDKAGELIFVAADVKPLLGDLAAVAVRAAAPAIDAAAARSTAIARLRPEGALMHDATELAIFPAADRARVVWASRIVPSGTPHGDWEILVDAATGELLRIEDLALYGDSGQGQAFMPDPLGSAGAQYNDPGFPDNNDLDSPELVAEIFDVVFPELLFEGGVWNLKSPYANCQGLLEDPNVDPDDRCRTQPTSTDFRLVPATRLSQRFEEMNVLFHIDAYMRYINETLGIPVAPNTVPGPVRFDPHGLSGADNSHFISSTDIVAFGDGCVDDSEDADVVIHELGHGIHDWITDGQLSQVQGLSEGLGDYFAVSYSRSFFPGQWTAADPEFNWVFSWDGHNPCWGGRVTTWNDDHLYTTALGGLHTTGQFWASCNIDVAEQIGYPETDEAVLEGISMTTSSTNQAQAAAAVMTAAQALGYTLPVRQTMAAIYNDASGGFGCNYAVTFPVELILDADFEENNLLEWSSSFP